VDDDRLYTFTAVGELVCLKTADGNEVWKKDYKKDFGGTTGPWGYCDRPLVDGDRLICVPGGARSTVVALDKKTGDMVWNCAVADGDRAAGYAPTVVSMAGGVRQYVVFLHGSVVGVSAKGKFLWRYTKVANRTGNNTTPLVRGDYVFLGSGYGSGIALVKLTASEDKDEVSVEEVYARKQALPNWHDSVVLVGGHVYFGSGQDVVCIEFATGKEVWKEKGEIGGMVSVTCADGHLYLRSPQGQVALVEVSPKGYAAKGKFRIPAAEAKPGSTMPVVTGGRLYLRDDDRLFCYDVRGGAAETLAPPERSPAKEEGGDARDPTRAGREGHDVFVPTPQDAVDKMLELAKIKKDETVYDLGCGDGRIVVTAARTYGCKAYGCDVDPECVKLSWANVEKHGVGKLVTIEHKDLFKLDLSGADVVTLYLLPRTNERLAPQLSKLKPGARIVSHAFGIPGLRPDRVETFRSGEDDLEHKIYLFTAPLQTATPDK
jgi:outer membrane protein assembly factor BamB